VAILQVLVYAGAVMVLFIFVIMLLDLREEDLKSDELSWASRGFVLVVGGILSFLVYQLFTKNVPAMPFQPVSADFGEAAQVGRLMFTKYLVPFELTSILLLVAMIGVLILSKRER